MTKKKEGSFTVEVSIEELRVRLHTLLSGTKDALLVSRTIIDLLGDSEAGYQRLYLAMSGIDPASKWKKGDQVWVPIKSLQYSWDFNEANTREAGLVTQDHVPGIVDEINISMKNPVSVKYRIVDKSKKEKESEMSFQDDMLTKREEDTFLENNQQENPDPKKSDDLPF